MKKILISLTILLGLISQESFAKTATSPAQNFEGAQVALGIASVGNDTHFRYQDPSTKYNADQGATGTVVVTNLTYLKAVNDNFLLGGGISYDLNGMMIGRVSTYSTDTDNTVKSKNHASIYLQPTYSFSETSALFAKIGYHSNNITMRDSGNNFPLSPVSYSNTVYGLGYGAGLMVFLNKNLFAKVEVEVVDYNASRVKSDATLSIKTTAGIFSLGYKF